MLGSEASNPWVYGCWACSRSAAAIDSTTRPAYITSTRSQKVRTRFRSWLMKISPILCWPTSFILNKRGEIVHKVLGEPDFAKLHALIDKLLAEPA